MINDIILSYKLDMDGEVKPFITDKITGRLEHIRIDCNSITPINLKCFIPPINKNIEYFSDENSFKILDLKQFTGHDLIMLRNETKSCDFKIFNYNNDKIYLNESLIFFIQGKKDTIINIQIRLSTDIIETVDDNKIKEAS